MLYKPSNPSPYNSVLDIDDKLSFSASCICTDDICGLRLAVKDDKCDYFLPVKSDKLKDCLMGSSITIPYDKDFLDEANGHYINTAGFARAESVSADSLLKVFTQYRWQVRLYQNMNSPTISIAYGSIQDVIKTYDENGKLQLRRILKIRPHTNMFFKHLDENGNHDTAYDLGIGKQFTEYYDDNAGYYIQINGNQYKVEDYYYSKTKAYYNSAKQQQSLDCGKVYNTPLFAFIEIDTEETVEVNEEGNEKRSIIEKFSADDEYTIYTNYIDSNEYYFECHQLYNPIFFDGNNKEITNYFSNSNSIGEENVIEIDHSNFTLKGSLPQEARSSINYYQIKLFQIMPTGKEVLIDDSGCVCGSDINYSCGDLLDGELYLLHINVCDTHNHLTNHSVYISPSYGGIVQSPISLVKAYREHNSVILDFSNLISITGHESNRYQGSHTISKEKIGAITTNICTIAPNNTVSFEKIDGRNKNIECENPLINLTFRCSSGDAQTIFEFITDNNVTYRLTWETYRFHLWAGRYITRYQNKVVYQLENGALVPKTVREEIRTLETICDSYYSPYDIMNNHTDTEILQAIQNAIADSELNYSVPYLDLPNLLLREDSYAHTESAAHDFWWHVIVADGYWYINCINAPQGYSWQNEAYFVKTGVYV